MISLFGASGFLGSAIVNSSLELGLEIDAVVRTSSRTNRISSELGAKIVSLEETSWDDYISHTKPDTVICAMWEGVGFLSRDDRATQLRNVERTLFLGQICKSYNIKTFITFGSQAEVPESSEKILEMQYEYLGNHYSQAKNELKSSLDLLFADTDIRFCWVRPFSVYGPDDTLDALIPSIYHAALTHSTFNLREPGRRWSALHINDFVSAIQLIVRSPHISGIVNVGNPGSNSIQEIVQEVECFLKERFPDWDGVNYYSPNELEGRIPVTKKLAQCGWSPQVTLQEGVESTLDWLSKHYPESIG